MENFGFNTTQESLKNEAIKNLKNPEIEKAELEILYIRQNIQTMGANDSEMPLINNLLIDLKSGKVLPEEAIRRANEILSSKQDYH